MIVWVLFLILGVLLGNVFGETSTGNIVDAQEGMAESSWPKKPGNATSSFSGKMTDFKQIDMRSYEKSKSFQSSRLYEDRKESSLSGTPLWAQGTTSSYQGKESAWSGRENSALDGISHREYSASRESSLQKKRRPRNGENDREKVRARLGFQGKSQVSRKRRILGDV